MEWKIASQKTIKGRLMKDVHESSSDLGQLFEDGYPTWYQELAESKVSIFGFWEKITKVEKYFFRMAKDT